MRTPTTDFDDRAIELHRFAATRQSRRWFRGSMVRALAERLGPRDRFVEMAAARVGGASTVVLVTTQHFFVARQPGPQKPVEVSVLALDEVTSAESTAADHLRLRTTSGTLDLVGFEPGDVRALAGCIRIVPARPVSVSTRRAGRRPMSDLEMVAALHHSGVLTADEFERVRNRLLSTIAARSRSASDPADV